MFEKSNIEIKSVFLREKSLNLLKDAILCVIIVLLIYIYTRNMIILNELKGGGRSDGEIYKSALSIGAVPPSPS